MCCVNRCKHRNSETFEENREVAQQGGNVAKAARKQLEDTTKKSVVSQQNAKQLSQQNAKQLPHQNKE